MVYIVRHIPALSTPSQHTLASLTHLPVSDHRSNIFETQVDQFLFQVLLCCLGVCSFQFTFYFWHRAHWLCAGLLQGRILFKCFPGMLRLFFLHVHLHRSFCHRMIYWQEKKKERNGDSLSCYFTCFTHCFIESAKCLQALFMKKNRAWVSVCVHPCVVSGMQRFDKQRVNGAEEKSVWREVESEAVSSYLSHSLADRWGTTVDFTTSFLHSSRFSAFGSSISSSGRKKGKLCFPRKDGL